MRNNSLNCCHCLEAEIHNNKLENVLSSAPTCAKASVQKRCTRLQGKKLSQNVTGSSLGSLALYRYRFHLCGVIAVGVAECQTETTCPIEP